MAGFASACETVAQIDALTDGVALILVLGPAHRAVPGLRRMAAAFCDREVLWHRLDCDGPYIAETAAKASSPRPLILVHGLERMPEPVRDDIEDRLNFVRDSLADVRATILLWVDREHITEFQTRCPDLYQWRSAVIELGREDIPISAEEEMRLHLLENEIRYAERHLLDAAGQPTSHVAIEPRVRDQEGREMGLFAWAESVHRGVLIGPPGSGKTTALVLLLHRAGLRELDHGPEGLQPRLTPMFMHWLSPSVFSLYSPVPPSDVLARWAEEPSLWFLIDRLDAENAAQNDQEQSYPLLLRLGEEYPRCRMTLAARASIPNAAGRFSEATLLPWTMEQAGEYFQRRIGERGLELIEMLKAQPESSLVHFCIERPIGVQMLLYCYEKTARVLEGPLDHMDVVEAVLAEWNTFLEQLPARDAALVAELVKLFS